MKEELETRLAPLLGVARALSHVGIKTSVRYCPGPSPTVEFRLHGLLSVYLGDGALGDPSDIYAHGNGKRGRGEDDWEITTLKLDARNPPTGWFSIDAHQDPQLERHFDENLVRWSTRPLGETDPEKGAEGRVNPAIAADPLTVVVVDPGLAHAGDPDGGGA